MANQIHKQPAPDYDAVVSLYDQIQSDTPAQVEDVEAEPWYQTAAGGDIILGGLYNSVATNEDDLASTLSGGLEVAEVQQKIDEYTLVRGGLNQAIIKRRRELQEKESSQEP